MHFENDQNQWSSHPELFCTKFTWKQRPRPATLLKKTLLHRCFSVNFAIFLRTPFLENTSGIVFWALYSPFRTSMKHYGGWLTKERFWWFLQHTKYLKNVRQCLCESKKSPSKHFDANSRCQTSNIECFAKIVYGF